MHIYKPNIYSLFLFIDVAIMTKRVINYSAQKKYLH